MKHKLSNNHTKRRCISSPVETTFTPDCVFSALSSDQSTQPFLSAKAKYSVSSWSGQILSASAVGSMKEEIHPGHLVMVDQFVDRTKMRHQTFFEDGIAAHVSFADPVCKRLQQRLVISGKRIGAAVHDGGAYVCIEGPMFSSRAESHIYRSWGVSVIGMTNYQEAKLAREAEICYATIALSTDYDCWHVEDGDVSVEMVVKRLQENVSKAQKTIADVLKILDEGEGCTCRSALKNAIMTDPKVIPAKAKKDLAPIVGKYLR